MEEWEIRVTHEFLRWVDTLDGDSYDQIVSAIDRLAEVGPGLGRPFVDRVEGSQVHNMKELRPGSSGRSEIRIMFVFDPWRSAILLIGGDKSGNWSGWDRQAIPRAEELYQQYLKERQEEAETEEQHS
ncbi:type II toxin-antitoxin system RelE/ParE family toxin [Actinoplanes derwentensis]|uniref:type II toxin-antitoxin system RelE/ParE family toxin n=1 Tax=Actinoplanes derwentensis TaxID=113562 RepID=UPI000B843677|nr:type II toxin-antitoxin system RelE/ParE family toxin [Actinoplanes derwentensis]